MSASVIDRRWSLAPLVFFTLVAGCARKGAAADAAKAEAHPVVAAETAVATAEPFTEVVGAIGTVIPRAGSFAVLSAPAATRVAKVLVATGQAVAKGDALVELEQSGFESALRTAMATQASAQAASDRWQRLVVQGIAPQKDLDQAKADLAKADADVVTAQLMLKLSVLRAPIAGVVTRMSASLGASVDPSQPLVDVADPSALDVLLSVEPADAARIKSGNKVTLHPGQRATAESLATGDVVDLAGVVDSASHSVSVRVRTSGAKRPLRIGETLFGEIVVAIRPRAVTVPIEALVPEGDGFKVFVVDSGDVAHARPVTVGGKTDKIVEVVRGVAAGERVVTYGAFGVEDGARIVAAAKGGAARPATPDSAAKP
jgi:membrane fusion protein (multidrug efflux system)